MAVVGYATGTPTFLELVERELNGLQFDVLSLEDVEPLQERKIRKELQAELAAAISELSDQMPVVFGSFHAYAE